MTPKPRKGKAKKCKCGGNNQVGHNDEYHKRQYVKEIAQLAVKDFPADSPKPDIFDEAIKLTTEAVEEQVKNLPEGPPKPVECETCGHQCEVKHIHVTEPAPQECDLSYFRYWTSLITLSFLWSIAFMWQWHHWSALWDQQKVVYLERSIAPGAWIAASLYNDCQSDWRDQQATIRYLRAWKRDHE